MAAQGTAVFAEAVHLVADALGVELDEVVCEAEYAQTTADVEMASWTIKAGHVAGVFASWQGRVDGKTVVDLNVRWRKGQTLDPDWKVEGDPWKITIDGLPTVTMQVGFLPPPDFIENRRSKTSWSKTSWGSATSSRRCHRSTRSLPLLPPPRASRPATISNYPRRAASCRRAADRLLDAGAALDVAEWALDADAGLDRIPAPWTVPLPIVMMAVTMSSARSIFG